MATIPKHHWGLLWRHNAADVRRDPAAEQLHRDRMTALIVLGIMAAIFAALLALGAINGPPAGSDMIEPWMMP